MVVHASYWLSFLWINSKLLMYNKFNIGALIIYFAQTCGFLSILMTTNMTCQWLLNDKAYIICTYAEIWVSIIGCDQIQRQCYPYDSQLISPTHEMNLKHLHSWKSRWRSFQWYDPPLFIRTLKLCSIINYGLWSPDP